MTEVTKEEFDAAVTRAGRRGLEIRPTQLNGWDKVNGFRTEWHPVGIRLDLFGKSCRGGTEGDRYWLAALPKS